MDGFVALRGGPNGGAVTSKALRYKGQRLLLNYAVREGGSMMLEVLNESGQIIGKSKPLSGDAIDAPVVWELEPRLSQGVVQLRFTLNNADAFSLRFD